jgi:hypothetical protein
MDSTQLPNGLSENPKPVEISFPLPNALGAKVHLHITNQSHSILVLGTTVDPSMPSSSAAPLGSLVYALPSLRSRSEEPSSTPLYSESGTIDFATRLAKALARKLQKPCYFGWSGHFSAMGRGGDVEEEIITFRYTLYHLTQSVENA